MLHSDARILTTHTGSLPRPPALADLLLRQEQGEPLDQGEFARQADAAIRYVVLKQLEAGIEIGNDGEQPRIGFQTYVPQRMSGFGGEGRRPAPKDMQEFPDYVWRPAASTGPKSRVWNNPQAVSEVRYEDLRSAELECEWFLRATDDCPQKFTERFMTAAAPGIIATAMLNAYYDSHEKYVIAIANEMRKEYEYIHSRGLVLQLDAPDLAMERSLLFQDKTLSEFHQIVEIHIDALNQAVKNIPRDRIRLHVCWGNYDGPHTHDVPLEDILPLLYEANVGALSLELANPRHQHEYKLFKKYRLPDSMVLIPGVIDSTTNYVEHPEVVADRICNAVEAVGDQSRVIAGTDCGFGTQVGWQMVAEGVVWAKLRALADGARIAARRLAE